mgnify:CR=1 FL=1
MAGYKKTPLSPRDKGVILCGTTLIAGIPAPRRRVTAASVPVYCPKGSAGSSEAILLHGAPPASTTRRLSWGADLGYWSSSSHFFAIFLTIPRFRAFVKHGSENWTLCVRIRRGRCHFARSTWRATDSRPYDKLARGAVGAASSRPCPAASNHRGLEHDAPGPRRP